MGGPKKDLGFGLLGRKMYPTESDNLTAESVQGTSLALEGVDDVHGGDGLPLGVLGVGDSVTDDVLQEDLQHSAGLLVDQTADALDASTTCQTTNGWLSDALDVVPQNFAMPLGSSLAQSFSALAASGHLGFFSENRLITLRTQSALSDQGVTSPDAAAPRSVRFE